MELVDNAPLRAAVEAFAAKPEQGTYLEVVRQCFQGDLLFDIGESDLNILDGVLQKGSTLGIREGTGPDGERALLAFTRQDKIPGDEPKSLAQPAPSVFEFAKSQGYGWVYIDAGGPTCAVKIADLDFVLRNPRNDAVKKAVPDAPATVEALRQGGQLLYAVIEHPDGRTQVRTSVSPDGAPVRLAYTSAAEVVVRGISDAFAAIDIERIVEDALEEPFTGLVINPAGPWVFLGREQLRSLTGR